MKKNIEIVPNIQKLFGIRDENLQMMESGLNVNIDLKSDSVQLEGAARDVARAHAPRCTMRTALASSF